MAYNSQYTGEQVDKAVKIANNNEQVADKVLATDGDGGIKYVTPDSGTEVAANPTLTGTETDLTGLEVDGVKYKIPSGSSSGGTLYLSGYTPNSYFQTFLIVVGEFESGYGTSHIYYQTSYGDFSLVKIIEDNDHRKVFPVSAIRRLYVGSQYCNSFMGNARFVKHISSYEPDPNYPMPPVSGSYDVFEVDDNTLNTPIVGILFFGSQGDFG